MKNKTNLRKILNLIQIVIFTVSLLLILFSPYKSYRVYERKYSYYTNGVAYVNYPEAYEYSPVIAEGTSHFFPSADENPVVLAACSVPVFFILVGIAMSVFSIIRKSLHRDSKLYVVIPFLAILSFAFAIFLLKDNPPVNFSSDKYYVYLFGTTPFLPVSILLWLTFIISLIKRSKSFNPEKVVKIETIKMSNANEIKQYKELLDSGAISQEEFDMKKKELLGL